MSKKVYAIVAMDQARVIGKDNAIPWRLPEDMRRFKELTSGHAVLMGRKTFESLPAKFKPLPNRTNLVVSSNPKFAMQYPEVKVWSSPERCLAAFRVGEIKADVLWVIGGAQIYAATINDWDEVYLTLVEGQHQGDAFFPSFESGFNLVEEERLVGMTFFHYQRRN